MPLKMSKASAPPQARVCPQIVEEGMVDLEETPPPRR